MMDGGGGAAAMLDPSLFAHMSTEEVKKFFEQLLVQRQQPEEKKPPQENDPSGKIASTDVEDSEQVFETCPQDLVKPDGGNEERGPTPLPESQFETCPSDPSPEKQPASSAAVLEDEDVFMSAESDLSSGNHSKTDLNMTLIHLSQESPESSQASSAEMVHEASVESYENSAEELHIFASAESDLLSGNNSKMDSGRTLIHLTEGSPDESSETSSVQLVQEASVNLIEKRGQPLVCSDMSLREPFPEDSSVVSTDSCDSRVSGAKKYFGMDIEKKSSFRGFPLVAYGVDDSSEEDDDDEVQVLASTLMPPPAATSTQKSSSSSQDSFNTWRARTPQLKTSTRVIVDVEPDDDSDWSDWEDPLEAARLRKTTRKSRRGASDSEGDSDSGSDASSVASSRRRGKNKELDLTADGIYGLKYLPPVEKLTLDEPPVGPFRQIGVIAHNVKTLLVVRSFKGQPSLDLGSRLFLKDGAEPLGKIFDVFGPVDEPYYIIRFNSAAEIVASGSYQPDTPVYFAPQCPDSSKLVFPAQLSLLKGTDASGVDDIEIETDDSDDDDEDGDAEAKKPAVKRPADGNDQYRGDRRRFLRGRRSRGRGGPRGGHFGAAPLFPPLPPGPPPGGYPRHPPPPGPRPGGYDGYPHHPPSYGGPRWRGPPSFGQNNVMANIFSEQPRQHYHPDFPPRGGRGQWNHWRNPRPS